MTLTILLLDTETNGLPKNRWAAVTEPGIFPAILQLSWAIYTVDGSALVPKSGRDIGVALHPLEVWDTWAAKIHGITETEARHGTPIDVALLALRDALKTVDVVVAHNLLFDKTVIRAAAYTAARRDPAVLDPRYIWPAAIREFCSMDATRNLIKLPATSKMAMYADLATRYKAPKLNELYAWLYGHMYDISGVKLHSAKTDTECLADCIRGLLSRGIINDKLLLVAGSGPATASPLP
jgi:DNA polymerase III epsilon subunit-like protein